MLHKYWLLIKITTATTCLAFATGQVARWSCHIHLLIELSHSTMLPPFITKKIKLKEIKLLHQGHASDSVDLIKSFCGILSFEATEDKATTWCSCDLYCCLTPEGFTKYSDLALTLHFWWVTVTCKPRSLMSTDYSVMLVSKSQQSHMVWSYKALPPHQIIVYTLTIKPYSYLVC